MSYNILNYLKLQDKLDKLAIDWSKFRDIDRVRVFHELDRLIRLENHAKLTKFHLNLNTSQKSLNLFKFPRPFFKDDSIFVNCRVIKSKNTHCFAIHGFSN